MKRKLLVLWMIGALCSWVSLLAANQPRGLLATARFSVVGDSVKRQNNTAVALARRGNAATALTLLDKAANARPSDTLAYNRALTLARLHRPDEMVAALASVSGFAHARINLALTQCRAGDWIAGRRGLETAVAQTEWADERAFNLAVAALQTNDPAAATRALDEAMRLRGNQPVFKLLNGDLAQIQGRHAEALRTYKSLSNDAEAGKGIGVRVGNALIGEKKWDEAAESFETHLASSNRAKYAFLAHFGLANARYGLQEYAKALTEYRIAVRLDTKSALAQTGVGNALCSLHDYKAAQRAYGSALALDPANQYAHLGMGVVAYRLGQFENAFEQFGAAGPLFDPKNPDLADCFLHRGLSRLQAGDYDAAQSDLGVAATLRPQHSAAYTGLSEVFRRQDGFGRAMTQLDAALGKIPVSVADDKDKAKSTVMPAIAHARMLANKGSLFLKMNFMDEAYPIFKKALAQNPANLNALNGLAIALLEMNQLDDARAIYDSLLAKGNKYAFLFNNRGIVRTYIALKLEKQRELHQAKQYFFRAKADFEQAQKIDSTRQFYQNNLGNVFKNIQEYEAAIKSYQAYLSKTAINNLGVLFACNRQGEFSRHYMSIALKLDTSNRVYHYNRYKVFEQYFKDSLAKRPDIQFAKRLMPTESISAKYSRDGYINVYLYDYDFDEYEYPADHVFPIRLAPPPPPDLLPVDDFVLMPDDLPPAKAAPPAAQPRTPRQRMPPVPRARRWGGTKCPVF